MGNNDTLVTQLVNDFFGQTAVQNSLAGGIPAIRSFESDWSTLLDSLGRRKPGDDGCLYVRKQEIMDTLGIDEVTCRQFVNRMKSQGRMEPAGRMWRLKDTAPKVMGRGVPIKPGVQVTTQQFPPLMALSHGSDIMSVDSCGKMQTHTQLAPMDKDPSNPGLGDMYFNEKLKQLRVYDGANWLKVDLE